MNLLTLLRGLVVTLTSHINMFVFFRVYSSNQKNEEKRGGSGSNNWGSVKDEVRSVYFCIFFSSVQSFN